MESLTSMEKYVCGYNSSCCCRFNSTMRDSGEIEAHFDSIIVCIAGCDIKWSKSLVHSYSRCNIK